MNVPKEDSFTVQTHISVCFNHNNHMIINTTQCHWHKILGQCFDHPSTPLLYPIHTHMHPSPPLTHTHTHTTHAHTTHTRTNTQFERQQKLLRQQDLLKQQQEHNTAFFGGAAAHGEGDDDEQAEVSVVSSCILCWAFVIHEFMQVLVVLAAHSGQALLLHV